jgi:hypothetical protein
MRRKAEIMAAVVAIGVLGALGAVGGSSAFGATARSVSEADNGKTVDVRSGDRLDLVLHSTYWTVNDPASPSVLVARGPARYRSGGAGCPRFPGSGCGTVTQTYRAANLGTVDVTAHRDSCGEAVACAPDQRDFKVTVHVVPR